MFCISFPSRFKKIICLRSFKAYNYFIVLILLYDRFKFIKFLYIVIFFNSLGENLFLDKLRWLRRVSLGKFFKVLRPQSSKDNLKTSSNSSNYSLKFFDNSPR